MKTRDSGGVADQRQAEFGVSVDTTSFVGLPWLEAADSNDPVEDARVEFPPSQKHPCGWWKRKRGIREAAKGAAHVFAIVAGITPAEEGAPAHDPDAALTSTPTSGACSRRRRRESCRGRGRPAPCDRPRGRRRSPTLDGPIYSLAEKELQGLAGIPPGHAVKGMDTDLAAAPQVPRCCSLQRKGDNSDFVVDYRGPQQGDEEEPSPTSPD